MNLTDKIKFIESVFGSGRYSSGSREILIFCPHCHHHKPKLSVNIETDKWHCFPCGKAGNNLYYLIRQFGSSDDLKKYTELYKSKNAVIKYKENNSFSLQLPEDYCAVVNCKNSILGKQVIKYLTQERKIEEEDILFYKLGISNGGIVFPSFDFKGNVNLYTIRYKNKGYFSPQVPKGYKNTIVLNELNIDWTKPVVIVEGFVDMLKSVRNTVPLFGSSLIRESKLFSEITKNKSKVMLCLDPDAKLKSLKILNTFLQYGIEVYNIDVSPFKDPGEMTKQEFKTRYDNAKLITKKALFKERLGLL